MFHTLALAVFLGAILAVPAAVRADIEVRVSVKFIHDNNPANTRPGGSIGTAMGFGTEVTSGNGVLAATGRGYSLKVVEYLDIQPPAPVAASASVTGGTTDKNATVTCGNTAGLQNFMRVQGTGIPANTVILSIDSNKSFTMSANATATNVSVAITASFPGDHWFNLPARAGGVKQYVEATALASQAVWAWNSSAINIYVNDTSSGQCSFVGGGSTITLGGKVVEGTVLHETGHFFNLSHTHALDYSSNTNPSSGIFTLSDLMDGDGLSETANDNPNIGSQDQLSQALFGIPYNQPATPPNAPFANAVQRAVVDSSFQNVMSYHTEAVLLPVQMDIWTTTANDARNGFCTGRTWFVANGGSDSASGKTATLPLGTLSSAVAHIGTVNDILLLRNGSYTAPSGGTISTPCTLRATRGDVIIHFP